MRLPSQHSCQRKSVTDMAKADMIESLDFLRKQAIEFGAVEAKIIPIEKIVIEDRVVFKCKLGCEKYGKTLACPPHAPKPEEFRKIVSEYHYAMFMKFKTQVEGDSELIKYLSKTDDPSTPPEMKAKVEKFWSGWKNEMKKLLDIVHELEKAAAKEGYLLAIGLVSGACQLCEKCNLEEGICIHPTMKRYSEEGVGVNVKATAEKAGLRFTLPFEKNPETFALLLID
jgi:predicted metal-binding protein